jgi:hypothetical protein
MLYLTPPSTQPVRDAMTPGLLGAITTPKQGNRILPGWDWAADNGCFGSGYPGDVPWIAWLARMSHMAATCLFAVAPDVVCDAGATLKRSAPLLGIIRALGYPAAFVLQNGVTPRLVPWDDCDVVFIGGDDEFKGSPAARRIADQALGRGMPVHMGRVNSRKRLLLAAGMGCASSDGKTMALYPATLTPMMRWLRDGRVQQGQLW